MALSFVLTSLTGKHLGGFYIACLAAFVAAAQQQHKLIAALLKIDPLAGAVVNTQLANALADRLNVTQKAVGYPEDPRRNDRLCAVIFELAFPRHERGGLFDRFHRPIVVYKSRQGKHFMYNNVLHVVDVMRCI